MTHFADKYHLTPQESLFLAEKKRDENIYCGMKMENRAVTFHQTQTILNGGNVPNVQLDDIQAILNMRDAWRYLVKTIDEPVTLAYLCKLNHDPCKQNPCLRRCRHPHHHGQAYGTVQHAAAPILQHR